MRKNQLQENAAIALEYVERIVGKMINWKAADLDLVQSFWFERLTVLHERLQHLHKCLDLG